VFSGFLQGAYRTSSFGHELLRTHPMHLPRSAEWNRPSTPALNPFVVADHTDPMPVIRSRVRGTLIVGIFINSPAAAERAWR
jgi:hypothetical protein